MVDLLTGQNMVHVRQLVEEEHRSLQDPVQNLSQHMAVKNAKDQQSAPKSAGKIRVQVNIVI